MARLGLTELLILIVPLFIVLVVIVAAGVLVYLATRRGREGPPAAHGAEDPALGIVRERYARGEITRDEYEEMRRALEG